MNHPLFTEIYQMKHIVISDLHGKDVWRQVEIEK
jgi:hypothetical protein